MMSHIFQHFSQWVHTFKPLDVPSLCRGADYVVGVGLKGIVAAVGDKTVIGASTFNQRHVLPLTGRNSHPATFVTSSPT